MREDAKIVVHSTGEQVLIGNAFHTLTDETRSTFETNSVSEFVRFVRERIGVADPGTAPFMIYFNLTEITMYGCTSITRHTKPSARCTLTMSAPLAMLISVLDRQLSIADVENFLRFMRPCLSGEGRGLLDCALNLKIQKIVSVTQSRDNSGNIVYSYKRESSGQGDFIPPQTIVFTTKIYEGLDTTISIPTEFFFSYKDDDGAVDTFWKFISPTISEDLKNAKIIAINDALGTDLRLYARYGTLAVHVADDGWKYKENKAL